MCAAVLITGSFRAPALHELCLELFGTVMCVAFTWSWSGSPDRGCPCGRRSPTRFSHAVDQPSLTGLSPSGFARLQQWWAHSTLPCLLLTRTTFFRATTVSATPRLRVMLLLSPPQPASRNCWCNPPILNHWPRIAACSVVPRTHVHDHPLLAGFWVVACAGARRRPLVPAVRVLAWCLPRNAMTCTSAGRMVTRSRRPRPSGALWHCY